MTGATFDRLAFEQTVDDVGSMLGDLWAVDEALKLADADHIRETGDGPVTPYARVGVDIGRHYPFRESVYIVYPEGEEPAGPYGSGGDLNKWEGSQAVVDQLAETGRDWGKGVAESIRSAVQHLVRPVPQTFQEAVELMRTDVINPLTTLVGDDFALLSSHLSDWEGGAADQFADYFYNQVEIGVRNQAFAAESVCVGLAGSKAIVHLGQHSLMGLVLSAKEVLEGQLKQRQAEHQPNEMGTSDWLLLGATFLALAAAIPTGGGSLTIAAAGAAAASASSALLEFGASQVEDGETSTFEALTAEDAQAQLNDRLGDITERVRRHWDDLEATMSDLRGLITEVDSQHLLYPRRPRLADGDVAPGGFHHESQPA